MEIIRLTEENRQQVDEYVREAWGGPLIVTLGNPYDSSVLPGFMAMEGSEIRGAVLYQVSGDACEIAVLYSLVENRGTGTLLLNTVIDAARGLGCRRVFLVTTNDNVRALRFYQKFGFTLKAAHIGSMAVTRRFKPGLPEKGIDGIPLAHEFEFEMEIQA